jgi:acyl-CoA reductase-like NAD-dependent aldehyde dehydrogenase
MKNEIVSRDPAHPEDVVGRFPQLDETDAEARLQRAVAAVPSWNEPMTRATALTRWAEALEQHAQDLALLVVREVGKPVREARAEVARGVAILRYYGQAVFDPEGELYATPDGKGELRVVRSPLGVVLAITPWNFPIAIPLWKVAPALATGNCVLLKPSTQAIAVAHRLEELADGLFPRGVLQLLPVDGAGVEAFLEDRRIAAVSFTGSLATGRKVIRTVANRGGAVQAELGGQNPAIVIDDADLESAARMIAGAAMGYAGQKCTATSRVIVHRSVERSFTDALVGAVETLHVGDPSDEATEVGPLISSGALDSVSGAVRAVHRRGAAVLTGGDAVKREGFFWQPTLMRLEDPTDDFAQEEVFGPAASLLLIESDEEAVRIANMTRYGLVGAVYGADLGRAERVATQLEAGLVRINAPTTGVDYYVPFGGLKESSYGPREQGRAARNFYSTTRTFTIYPAS